MKWPKGSNWVLGPKKKGNVTKIPPSKQTSGNRTLWKMRFRHFWGFPQNEGWIRAKTTIKIVVSENMGSVSEKGGFGTEGSGGNLDPGPGESGPENGRFCVRSFCPRFPLLKRSVLQREAFWGPNPHH